MVKAGNHFEPDQVRLTGRLSEFREALQEEIKEIENNGQNSTLLVGGHIVEAKGGGFWHCFFVEYMPLLPADTPCKLTVGTDQFDEKRRDGLFRFIGVLLDPTAGLGDSQRAPEYEEP